MHKINHNFTENDYLSITNNIIDTCDNIAGLSIIIPTYNRSHMLAITLACLYQQICSYKFEIIVADDGSVEDTYSVVKKFEALLDISYVWQEDLGYRLSAVRNLGMAQAKYSWIAILDCDMAPTSSWVESYCKELDLRKDIALIGHREYVNTNDLDYKSILSGDFKISKLERVQVTNDITHAKEQNKFADWRLSIFKSTNNLLNATDPYRYFSGGNIAFHKSWINIIGAFDESFTDYGGEDNEFAYRLFRAGCFLKNIVSAVAYHQEPPSGENETDRVAGAKITRRLTYKKIPTLRNKVKLRPDNNCIPLMSVVLVTSQLSRTKIPLVVDSIRNDKFVDLEIFIICATTHEFNLYSLLYKNLHFIKPTLLVNNSVPDTLNLCNGYLIVFIETTEYLPRNILNRALVEYRKNSSLGAMYYYYKSARKKLLDFILHNNNKSHTSSCLVLKFTTIRTINLAIYNKQYTDLPLFDKIERIFGCKSILI